MEQLQRRDRSVSNLRLCRFNSPRRALTRRPCSAPSPPGAQRRLALLGSRWSSQRSVLLGPRMVLFALGASNSVEANGARRPSRRVSREPGWNKAASHRTPDHHPQLLRICVRHQFRKWGVAAPPLPARHSSTRLSNSSGSNGFAMVSEAPSCFAKWRRSLFVARPPPDTAMIFASGLA
jgi:hypothetical protein